MGEARRPNIHAEVLLGAAIRYGDAKLAQDKALTAWSYGDPRETLEAVRVETREATDRLHSAARAYATRMRRKAKAKPTTAEMKGDQG